MKMCSARVFDMLQCWALQFGASLADKVESSRILGYVVHCLSSIVVNEYTCMMGSRINFSTHIMYIF